MIHLAASPRLKNYNIALLLNSFLFPVLYPMTNNFSQRNRILIVTGLGISLVIAIFLSPFASNNPDGLERVAQDLQFDKKALKDTPARKLPFSAVFEDYSLHGVPSAFSTPLAGLLGTLVTFGLAWGIGKLVIRPAPSDGEREGDGEVDK
jgi:cobalt/nickel transport protein